MTDESKVKTDAQLADGILEESKGEFQSLVIAGINTKGDMFLKTSVQNVPFMHYLLSKATFELNLFEKQNSNPVGDAESVDEKAEK
jgi:hypothetical protein